jgi:2-oxoacid:acceptor oxidoreductase gamma subunit (pyruvate/2-ketoisovalerate family)
MTTRQQRLLDRLERGFTVDLRGHGKAGGGLVLAVQSFGAAIAEEPGLDVQDWPLFSSARKGANVCAYLRVARGSVQMACAVAAPDIVVLMNEAAADEVDFAQGAADALFVLNSRLSPEAAAARWRLGGTVVCVPGDDLGLQYLGRPLANVAVLAALVRASGLVAPDRACASLESRLHKRRVPDRVIAANLSLWEAAQDRASAAELPRVPHSAHSRPRFEGYGDLPPGAQSALRTATGNRTAGYGRPGVRIEFADAAARCNGCALCVAQCPEGIIEFTPDPARGTLVRGARFDDYCKKCRECVQACPLDLFREVSAVARPEGAAVES